MNNSRLILINAVVLLLLIGGGFAAYYYYNQSYHYITTDNARIDGQLITINALGTGKISDWKANVGSKLSAGQSLGTIQLVGAGTTTTSTSPSTTMTMNITTPANGTIVQQNVIPNSFVAAGTTLARAYDMDNLWVSANINETDMSNIKQNEAVDVSIDTYPGTTLTGKITQIGLTTAAQFSLLPQQNTNANFTKVIQVVPIVITLDGYKGLNLIPGMSVTAQIHIRE
ncbi:efflux RND transporter periplasmic adaptor subunit [Desulfosporosinus sp. OT]|uniref:HlyD family secretion protein n=1 Tax=Desulfosporosinus sp. OT TaxID=913865 RepID=UPI000223A05A|nr:efflux RND transporter periplasmic adaptor subunit [Desulfosporosinus sp. OT]EGW37284.1 multidrug resistance protein A [Desulfosporosinus sp. OT]